MTAFGNTSPVDKVAMELAMLHDIRDYDFTSLVISAGSRVAEAVTNTTTPPILQELRNEAIRYYRRVDYLVPAYLETRRLFEVQNLDLGEEVVREELAELQPVLENAATEKDLRMALTKILGSYFHEKTILEGLSGHVDRLRQLSKLRHEMHALYERCTAEQIPIGEASDLVHPARHAVEEAVGNLRPRDVLEYLHEELKRAIDAIEARFPSYQKVVERAASTMVRTSVTEAKQVMSRRSRDAEELLHQYRMLIETPYAMDRALQS